MVDMFYSTTFASAFEREWHTRHDEAGKVERLLLVIGKRLTESTECLLSGSGKL